MPYGTIKVDQVIYTKGGSDTTITVSGIVDSLSGAISVTGAISGASVSAATGTFTTLSGNTTAGTTATFVTGVFTTSLSGATITGNTGQFSNITGVSGVFTTRISGATITGNTGQFSSITGISGVFTSVSGTTFTVTSGVFASGTAAAPSVSVGTTTNGLYSSATNQIAVTTSGTSRLIVDDLGNVNIDSGTFYVDAVNNRVGIGTTGPVAGTLIDAYQALYPLINVRCNGNGAAGYGSSTDNQTNLWFFGARKDGIGGSIGTDRFNLLYNASNLMTVDTSGNLGLGVVPSGWDGTITGPLVFGTSAKGSLSYAGGATSLGENYYRNATGFRFVTAAAASIYQQTAGSHVWYSSSNTPSVNGVITFTQSMTLDASGNLFIRATSNPYGLATGGIMLGGGVGGELGVVNDAPVNTGTAAFWKRVNGAGNLHTFSVGGTTVTTVGSISTDGTSTTYATTSDYRLKENIAPVNDGIMRLQRLKPSRFNFLSNPKRVVDGFIAHEVQAVVPEAVTGKKDALDDDGNPIYQGIDQSKLVPLLTAALQEAIAKIESLESRLTAAGI